MSGLFVAFEGADGSGKSTQARLLAERVGAVLTREPGGTPLGEKIRELFIGGDGADPTDRAEALLVAASRAQHVDEVIVPALAAGRTVVSDRFTDSSIVYQGHARGLDVAAVAGLSAFATGGVRPDVVVLIDVVSTVTDERLVERDRFEREADAFHDRVRTAYRELAAAEPDRWVVVDGQGSVDAVAERVWSALGPWLGRR